MRARMTQIQEKIRVNQAFELAKSNKQNLGKIPKIMVITIHGPIANFNYTALAQKHKKSRHPAPHRDIVKKERPCAPTAGCRALAVLLPVHAWSVCHLSQVFKPII